MNNKAKALRNLSVPAFEVTNTPAADEAARRLHVWFLPEAAPCLSPTTVTSTGLMVPLRVLGDISLNCFLEGFAETLGQILNASCFGAGKQTQEMARGTPGGEDVTCVGTLVFPRPYLRSPCHHPKPAAQLSLACFNGPMQHAPSDSSQEQPEK